MPLAGRKFPVFPRLSFFESSVVLSKPLYPARGWGPNLSPTDPLGRKLRCRAHGCHCSHDRSRAFPQFRQQRRFPKCAATKAIPPIKLTKLAGGMRSDQESAPAPMSIDGQQSVHRLKFVSSGGRSAAVATGNNTPSTTHATPSAPAAAIHRRPCTAYPRRSENAATGRANAAITACEAGCTHRPPSRGAASRSTGAEMK